MVEIVAFLTTGFWMWMIIDCLRNDPDRNSWIWLLIFLNFPGAVIYFVVRRLPHLNVPIPSLLRRWSFRKQLWAAEADVKNIGKAHQYTTLGNVQMKRGQWLPAKVAYQEALEREPENTAALWGLASLAVKDKEWVEAQGKLEQLLTKDAEYKRGDASLLYGKVLVNLPDQAAAIAHLKEDIRYWSHPESALMLGTIQAEQGEIEAARESLETMVAKLRACPAFYYRKHRRLAQQADRKLKSLRSATLH